MKTVDTEWKHDIVVGILVFSGWNVSGKELLLALSFHSIASITSVCPKRIKYVPFNHVFHLLKHVANIYLF